MKPWHAGLAETQEFIVFAPPGRRREFAASKGAVQAHLQRLFPDCEFEIDTDGLSPGALVIPLCGRLGEDGNGTMRAPPSIDRMREIEAAIEAFNPTTQNLS